MLPVWKRQKAILLLEDGTVFQGYAFAGQGRALGEVVFNTSMTGYQEVLTDPSYKGQIVAMTYPLTGTYGINPEDMESAADPGGSLHRQGIPGICQQLAQHQDSGRFPERTPQDRHRRHRHPCAHPTHPTGRSHARHHRHRYGRPARSSWSEVQGFPGLNGSTWSSMSPATKPYRWREARQAATAATPGHRTSRGSGGGPGLRCQVQHPAKTRRIRLPGHGLSRPHSTAEEILATNPTGSSFPMVRAIRRRCTTSSTRCANLHGKATHVRHLPGPPAHGPGAGRQTFKLKFGHRGANQPVKDLTTGKVEITSQNHGFCVDLESLTHKLPCASPISTSTTIRWRAWNISKFRPSACSTTRKRPPALTMHHTSSSASSS